MMTIVATPPEGRATNRDGESVAGAHGNATYWFNEGLNSPRARFAVQGIMAQSPGFALAEAVYPARLAQCHRCIASSGYLHHNDPFEALDAPWHA